MDLVDRICKGLLDVQLDGLRKETIVSYSFVVLEIADPSHY
jgi:hypothetical protein